MHHTYEYGALQQHCEHLRSHLIQVDLYSCGHSILFFYFFIFVTPSALRSYTFLFHKFPTVPWQNKLTRFSRVGLFHTLHLDDTSDIQKPVVLLASWSISSQSGGVYLGECINGPTNQRQGYEADWINTVEVPVHYAPVCLPR